uniref:Uncharacterized protein LOC113787027 n=1 Tax=Cicer arietinum TaxID=3827 RepID=A0A3Q7YFV8_CICAR|nr:uncharacterized protein LOC113787027 [Cicer arietinum]
MHILFDEFDDLDISKKDEEEETQNETQQETSLQKTEIDKQSPFHSPPKSWKTIGDHPQTQIIGDTADGIRTRRSFKNDDDSMAMISQIEPKSIKDAITDQSWINAMKEELLQFEKNEVWTLVPDPLDQTVIGTRWVFRNKLDEEGKVVRNKARLVAQGYNQRTNYWAAYSSLLHLFLSIFSSQKTVSLLTFFSPKAGIIFLFL